jgi:hypothetical protein
MASGGYLRNNRLVKSDGTGHSAKRLASGMAMALDSEQGLPGSQYGRMLTWTEPAPICGVAPLRESVVSSEACICPTMIYCVVIFGGF